ncbi:MAG: 50S ribosomal protein L18 [Candidatus Lloydbacteria bacterium]|nr:50S ribosomal protein L18 [Candidatus Lloydbacteria bacterium]
MKHIKNRKIEKRERRHKRIRAKVQGTDIRPRLAVFKSNRYLYGQLINDDKGVTVAAVSDAALSEKGTKTEKARLLGKALAEAAMKKKITTAVFDRGGFVYTGRIKAFAEGAREGGLVF